MRKTKLRVKELETLMVECSLFKKISSDLWKDNSKLSWAAAEFTREHQCQLNRTNCSEIFCEHRFHSPTNGSFVKDFKSHHIHNSIIIITT